MVTQRHVEEPATASQLDHDARRIQREKNQAAIDLLDSWLNESNPDVIREQRETWEALKKALGEDRDSYRKLFC